MECVQRYVAYITVHATVTKENRRGRKRREGGREEGWKGGGGREGGEREGGRKGGEWTQYNMVHVHMEAPVS